MCVWLLQSIQSLKSLLTDARKEKDDAKGGMKNTSESKKRIII
jgi:hypothetical protein